MGHSLPKHGKIVLVPLFHLATLTFFYSFPYLRDGNILRIIKNCLENALQNNQTKVKQTQTNKQKFRKALKIMLLSKTILRSPWHFILRDLGRTSHSPKACSLGCALKLGGSLQEGFSKGVLLLQPEVGHRSASPPVLCLFLHCKSRFPPSRAFGSTVEGGMPAKLSQCLCCQLLPWHPEKFHHLLFGIFSELVLISLRS